MRTSIQVPDTDATYSKGSIAPGYTEGSISYIEAVANGKKPVTEILSDEAEALQLARNKGLLIQTRTINRPMSTEVILVTQDTSEGRAAADNLVAASNMSMKTSADQILRAIAVGRAYGYSDSDIAAYLKQTTRVGSLSSPTTPQEIQAFQATGELPYKPMWTTSDIAKAAPGWIKAVGISLESRESQPNISRRVKRKKVERVVSQVSGLI